MDEGRYAHRKSVKTMAQIRPQWKHHSSITRDVSKSLIGKWGLRCIPEGCVGLDLEDGSRKVLTSSGRDGVSVLREVRDTRDE